MEATLAQSVSAYLHRNRPALVEFLKRLALAESPSTHPEAQDEVLGIISEALAELGYAVRRLPGRSSGGHLYARPEQRERHAPVQVLLGHCDTVWPLGTLEEMPVAVADGVIRGPGVYDMKCGLAQMVFALRVLRDLELETPVPPVVFINSDEEVGSKESARHIRRLARVAERAFVLEPSLGPSGKLKTARKGVGRFSVTVEGQAAHAGLNPEEGASAILELSYLIQALFALNDPARGTTVNVGTIDGGLRPNVVAPQSKAVVEARVPTGEEARRVEKAILGLKPSTPGVTLRVEGGMGRPPMERTHRNRRLWERARELGGTLGLRLEEGVAGGASDGNTTSLFTATLDGLGAVGDGAHARHEFAYADAMVERCALLVLLLMEPPIEDAAA
jgi:glutamate carboxypeptidase